MTAALAAVAAVATAAPARGEWVQSIADLGPSDGALGDEFGSLIVVSGNTAIVGSPFHHELGDESGAAYINRSVNGIWVEEQKLMASDGEEGDRFGWAVALEGDTAVVGAMRDDDLGSNAGAVYVFADQDGVWTETQKLVASDAHDGAHFGSAVTLEGDTLVVGSYSAGGLGGAAYVFEHDGSGWHEVIKINPPPGAANFFGHTAALSGDTLVFGNYLATGNGAAFVFRRNGSSWFNEQMLVAADGLPGDLFGWSIAVHGDVIVVGSKADWAGESSGAAYVFRFDPSRGVWMQEAKLTAFDADPFDQFGSKVAVQDHLIVIGADWQEEDGSYSDEAGAAYVFRFNGTFWDTEAKLKRSPEFFNDHFGSAVSISGDVVAVGARGAVGGTGRVSVYLDDFVPPDCNGNGTADVEDLMNGFSADCNANGIPDECDVASGDSSDVNGNDIPDDCEADCNGNGLPDGFEILDGLADDCNKNGVPDTCDIASGSSSDANENGIPDDCEADCNANGVGDAQDIADGTSTDCNGNGFPDECEGVADYAFDSGALSPIGAGFDQSFTIESAAMTLGDVTLTITAQGDFSSITEWVDVDLNGVALGSVFVDDAGDCSIPADQTVLVVPVEVFNAAILGEPDAVITMTASELVSPTMCEDDNHIALSVAYTGIGINDADGNGVPDECDVEYTDCNGNGVPDEQDIAAGTSADCDGNGWPDECDIEEGKALDLNDNGVPDACECEAADTDGSGQVDVQDMVAVVLAWGEPTPHLADINDDGQIDIADLLAVISIWGLCMP